MTTTLPPDLQSIRDQIDAADRAGAALAAGVSEEQFHWRPYEGRGWSIAQCLEHLAIMNEHYAAAVRTGVEDGRRRNLRRTGPGRSTFFGRRFIQSQEPPVKMKLKAPKIGRSPRNKPRDEIVRAYHEAHDFIRQLITDAADVDLTRATFQNPFIPIIRMRVVTGLAILAAHDRRHLWQAEQVKLARGYPQEDDGKR
jgi:diadenosine tetraphosphatase ApaH/serine/threonine PP2A family protein phosphatase